MKNHFTDRVKLIFIIGVFISLWLIFKDTYYHYLVKNVESIFR